MDEIFFLIAMGASRFAPKPTRPNQLAPYLCKLAPTNSPHIYQLAPHICRFAPTPIRPNQLLYLYKLAPTNSSDIYTNSPHIYASSPQPTPPTLYQLAPHYTNSPHIYTNSPHIYTNSPTQVFLFWRRLTLLFMCINLMLAKFDVSEI